MILVPTAAPWVGILENSAAADWQADDLAVQFALCRAAGVSFLGLPAGAPQDVLVVHHRRTREELLEEVADASSRLGIADDAVTRLRVVGYSKDDWLTKTEFLLRVRRVADDIPADQPAGLIVFLDAIRTLGIGYAWDGREAWGAGGREGWPRGPLQWQRWFSGHARWQMLNVLTPRGDEDSLANFRKNARAAVQIGLDEAADCYVLTDAQSGVSIMLGFDDDGNLRRRDVKAGAFTPTGPPT
jgi:hypothetical protein